MDDHVLVYPWDVLAELQARERSITKIGPWAEAHRAKLDFLVDLIASGNVPDRQTLARRLTNVEINRQKTYRRRREIDATFAAVSEHPLDNALDVVVAKDGAAFDRSIATANEWALLWALATDSTYADLKSQTGLSLNALKTRISRSRSRIRRQLTTMGLP